MQISKSLNRFGNREETRAYDIRDGQKFVIVEGVVRILEKELEDAEEENEEKSV